MNGPAAKPPTMKLMYASVMHHDEDIAQLEAFMQAVRSEIASMNIMKREFSRYPFDWLAEETLSKTYGLIRAVLTLLQSNQTEEAFGLSRSIVECAMNLRWITADPHKVAERSYKFFRYGFAVKQFWYWWINKRAPEDEEKERAHHYAKEWHLIADASGAFVHWSGERQFAQTASELPHPKVGADLVREDHAAKRAIDYFHPSCFVHCSQPGMDSYFSTDPIFGVREPGFSDMGLRAIWICNLYLHEIVTYALSGMNVYLSKPVDSLGRHSVDEMSGQFRFVTAEQQEEPGP